MKVRTLIYFFLTLQDGNTGLINSEELHTGTEGGNITVKCKFYFSGSRKLFCKEECTTGNILIETTNDRAQRDRYSIEYKERSNIMYVSITQLKKSDSGWYTCSLDRTFGPDGYEKFELLVTEALTALKPNSTHQTSTSPSSSSTQPPTTTSTTQSSVFCSSTESTKHPGTESPSGSGTLLYVSLTLVTIIIILLVAVLIFCRKKPKKIKEHLRETVYAETVREVSQVYEEIEEEDRQSRSPDVKVSTVYAYAKYNKPNGVDTTDEYSLVTVPAACAQNPIKDISTQLIYSQVDFPNVLHSVSSGNTDNVIYSAPRVQASSTNGTNDSSPSLYSNVALHQV
ncbi:uncharacterized protein LOC113167641 [Anabas testudineus]|uniref:uncharacterized protein LOC113167641 n=1 Tax=Anabas testudineus TaxID=64144 RepID=UPI000E45859E|nr:uncharacterized protein LOC113167641 [Anabas testudineus]